MFKLHRLLNCGNPRRAILKFIRIWLEEKKGFPGGAIGKESADQCRTQKTCQSLGWEDPLEEKCHLTPAFLLGESHGQRSLMGYN